MFQPFKDASRSQILQREPRRVHAPPLYFLELRIANFRSFRDHQALDLSDGDGSPCPWNVVIGAQGVGKSALLQSLLAVSPKYVESQDGSVRMVARVFGEQRVAEHFISPSANDAHTEVLATFRGATNPKSGELNKVELYFDIGGNGDLSSKHVEISDRGSPVCAYGANRHLARPASGSSRRADSGLGLFEDFIALPNPEDSIGELLFLASNSSRHQLAARACRPGLLELLVNLFPDILEVQVRDPEQLGEMPTVNCRTASGWHPISQMSNGFRSVMGWVADFVIRLLEHYPRSTNPLAEPAICMVDEIELHMHPAWQRNLMERLTRSFPATQFIVTTNSPLIIKASEGGNLIMLHQQADRVRFAQATCEVADWTMNDILACEAFGFQPEARAAQAIVGGRGETQRMEAVREGRRKDITPLPI